MKDIVVELTEEGIKYPRGTYKVAKPSGCWLCQFARYLLRLDFDPSRGLVAYREGTKVFERSTIGKWADLTTHENNGTSVRLVKYVPFERND